MYIKIIIYMTRNIIKYIAITICIILVIWWLLVASNLNEDSYIIEETESESIINN